MDDEEDEGGEEDGDIEDKVTNSKQNWTIAAEFENYYHDDKDDKDMGDDAEMN